MTELKKPTTAIYVRVSTEDQASQGLSIPAQIDTLSHYCQAYGISIYKIYEDPGISGKDTINRPALNDLIMDSHNSLFDMVLVWKISRLSRNLKDLLYLIDLFEKNKITFTSYSEKFDTSTPVGKMTLQLLGSIAEFERNTIVENVKLGLREYARRGGKTGTVLGYRTVEKKLVVDEKEAEIVKTIFDLYVNKDISFNAVAGYLNSEGFKTKFGKQFRGDSVSLILGNPVYIGVNRHQLNTGLFYEVVGNHEPIITEDLWKAAQEKINERRKYKVKKKTKTCLMLDGIILCPFCSQPMGFYYSISKGKRYNYYKCSKHAGSVFYFRSCKMDETVKMYITALLCNRQVVEDLEKAFFDRVVKYNVQVATADCTKSRKAYLQQLIGKYMSLLENELLKSNPAVNDRIRELANMINDLDRKLEVLGTVDTSTGENMNVDFGSLLNEFKNSIMDTENKSLNPLSAAFINCIIPEKDGTNSRFEFSFPINFE